MDSYEWGKMANFLEEDLVTHKAAASELALEKTEALYDSDDYHSIIDGLDSGISPDAIQEALKKCSPIDVDKEQINTVHQEPILKYPSVAGAAIEDAAKGLFLGENPSAVSPELLLILQKEKVASRNHYIHILQQDLDHLEPGEYLNDCMVDFWMMWITRKEPAEDNNFIIYNKQFHTALETQGVEHVLHWSDRRDTDTFS
jgi:hypothetical protein